MNSSAIELSLMELISQVQPKLASTPLGQELLNVFLQKQLQCVYQPIIDLRKRQIFAHEALVRGPTASALHHPLNLFKVADDHQCLFEADTFARVESIKQFSCQQDEESTVLLFLNISVNSVMSCFHQKGLTEMALEAYGIKPEQVVIEITELQPINNFSEFSEAINYYRQLGFKVALDDLGSGYNGLKVWSELKPDYVKIDRHFISDIHKDPNKKHFMETLAILAKGMKTKIVAEGVESEQELRVLESLDIDYVQGYLFKKPVSLVASKIDYQWKDNSLVYQVGRSNQVAEIVTPYPSVEPNEKVEAVAKKLLKKDQLDFYPVVENDEVKGMIWRRNLMELLARRFGQDLHGRKTIKQVMDVSPLVVEDSLSLVDLSRMITDPEHKNKGDAFIVVKDSKYVGCANFNDLLRKITDLKVENAQQANPLSGLPGNVPIQQHIRYCLDRKQYFEMVYIDVDHFKPFNDFYSFEQGDDVIRLISKLLMDITLNAPNRDDSCFLGHIGGDDFVLMTGVEGNGELIAQQLSDSFAKQIVAFYEEKDQLAGGISAVDRKGLEQFFPIMSLSLGVLLVHPGVFDHTQKLASFSTKAKKCAKTKPGNAHCVFDSRDYEEKTRLVQNQSSI